ncbi:ABC transporter permease [Erysipelothrix aquatica]|uniref:ABC transporter permease n=1 Tax=Erysipelothrix aquatica TaxID=2683714 RepID=UPI00191624CA|nr:ABC transporter permease [Erysipelothrix aquatica]
MKKLRNTNNKRYAFMSVGLVIVLWQLIVWSGIVPQFMLPGPASVIMALYEDRALLWMHAQTTLLEAFLGLLGGVGLGVTLALLMDRYDRVYRMVYPLMILTQTVPTVAVAPLLVLWLGYGILPKIVLIVLTSFFPMAIGCFQGLQAVDRDSIQLLRSMGANTVQQYQHVRIPESISPFFASLKIAVSYAVVGAVIAEWLGGTSGLGVYMTRVRKAYAFDKMFAVIVLISLLSLLLMGLVNVLERKAMPWKDVE